MTDHVNHPPHYTEHPSGVECIEITEWLGFSLGNAFKYLFRRNDKGDLRENLEKAIWYLERERGRTGVWIDQVPKGTIETLQRKTKDIIGHEPTFIGVAMSTIVEAATGGDFSLDEAIVFVRAEIRRVCP